MNPDEKLYHCCIKLANLLMAAIATNDLPMGKTVDECQEMFDRVNTFILDYECNHNTI
jgi:hypothetical protein